MRARDGEATQLEMVHVLIMDVVGYTLLSLDQQYACIEDLQALVRATPTFQRADEAGSLLSHPAGDGMALAFFHDPSAPVQCALDIAETVQGRADMRLRMGIHSGPIFRAEDINRAPNVRGPAINTANRVMDCGSAGHILVSHITGDMLRELSTWSDVLTELGEAELKHGQRIRIYNLVDGALGNPAVPPAVESRAVVVASRESAPDDMRVSHEAHVTVITSDDVDATRTVEAIGRGNQSYHEAESRGVAMSACVDESVVFVFLDDIVSAARCAVDIFRSARRAVSSSLWMGIHTGPLDAGVAGVGAGAGNPVSGSLVDRALEIASVGDDGHILLSQAAADGLQPDGALESGLRALGPWRALGEDEIPLHSLVLDDVGQAETPSRMRELAAANAPDDDGAAVQVALLYRRHAEPDDRILRLLEDRLIAAGHKVFIDRHMTIGVEWAQEIEAQIRASEVVIPLLSQGSVDSEMLQYELKVAYDAAQENDGRPRILPVRIDFDGPLPTPIASILDPLQQFYWTDEDDDDRMLSELATAIRGPVRGAPTDGEPVQAPVGGAVPIDSELYVVRPTDDLFHRSIARQDSIVLVKGARQMGKTSLIARGLQQAREDGIPAVFSDLQALSPDQISSSEEFFLSLGYSLAEQLDLDDFPEDTWTGKLGPGVNFERYLRRVVLKDVDRLVWALDEVDRMPSTAYASEVFGLFRSWHNKRALDPTGPWSRLTLTIAYATEAHLFITDVNQSPFNVGTRLELDDFDASQMAELNGRYGAPLTGAEVERFAQLVGGHPYLTQRGFQAIVEHGATYAEIEATASDEDGLYGDHLRRILFLLAQNEERRDVVRKLIRGDSAMDAETFYHLRTAGLLTGASARGAGFRNGLYASYLTRHLS